MCCNQEPEYFMRCSFKQASSSAIDLPGQQAGSSKSPYWNVEFIEYQFQEMKHKPN